MLQVKPLTRGAPSAEHPSEDPAEDPAEHPAAGHHAAYRWVTVPVWFLTAGAFTVRTAGPIT